MKETASCNGSMPPQGPVAEETDRETVINRAIEVIGDEKEAMR
jgi:hypothetical protein